MWPSGHRHLDVGLVHADVGVPAEGVDDGRRVAVDVGERELPSRDIESMKSSNGSWLNIKTFLASRRSTSASDGSTVIRQAELPCGVLMGVTAPWVMPPGRVSGRGGLTS